jgi:hypothetical protein
MLNKLDGFMRTWPFFRAMFPKFVLIRTNPQGVLKDNNDSSVKRFRKKQD